MCVPGNKRPTPVAFNLQLHHYNDLRNRINLNRAQSNILNRGNEFIGCNFTGSGATTWNASHASSQAILNSNLVTVGTKTTNKAIISDISSDSSSSTNDTPVLYKLSPSERKEIEDEIPVHERKKRKRKPQSPGKTATLKDRQFVQHSYHDHSNDLPEEEYVSYESLEDSSDENREKKGVLSLLSFPYRLHKMLDSVADDGLESVISWQPHGRAFVIHKPKAFANIVLPHYFSKTKLTSFQRQLNLYGFLRISHGRDAGGYYHELFLRGRLHLCDKMNRIKVKGTGYKAASNPSDEPNFYTMAPVQLLADAKSQVTPTLPPFVNVVKPDPRPAAFASSSFSLKNHSTSPQDALCKPDCVVTSLNDSPYERSFPQNMRSSCLSKKPSPIISARSAVPPSPRCPSEALRSNPVSFSIFNEDEKSMVDDIVELFSGAENKEVCGDIGSDFEFGRLMEYLMNE